MWLGFDIGGTKLAIAVADAEGRIVARHRRLTGGTGDARRDVDAMLCDAHQLLDRAGISAAALRGVGVSVPGAVDIERGVVESPPNLVGWERVPVAEWFGAELGVPVHVENDANAAALAEWRFGSGKGARHVVYLTMSTGVGGGLVLDGRLYRGTGGAGEVGHIPVEWDGEPCRCGGRGCLEAYVGGRAWTDRLARVTPAQSRVTALAGPGKARPEHVVAAAREGDAFACAEFGRWNHYLARGLVILTFALAPERFVLGTIATAAGDALCFAPLRRMLAARVWPAFARHCEILPSALGPDAPYYAALCAALEAQSPSV